MRFMKLFSRRYIAAYAGAVLGLIAVLGIVPGAFVTAKASAEDKVEQKVEKKDKVAQKEKTERGRFVSFQDGTLIIQDNSGALLETKVPASAKTLVWNDGEKLYKPAATVAALSQVQPGIWFYVHVGGENVAIRIGSRKGVTTGTFVSFKDNRLLILGTNLGESFTKKYGNSVHFHKFRDDVPVYESIDGGEYQLIGTPGTVLGNVKEGTIVTVHGEGDDNITHVQIGVPKKQ